MAGPGHNANIAYEWLQTILVNLSECTPVYIYNGYFDIISILLSGNRNRDKRFIFFKNLHYVGDVLFDIYFDGAKLKTDKFGSGGCALLFCGPIFCRRTVS